MHVKICGITNLVDALLCQTYGADAIGFIFYPQSKRYIRPGDAAKVIDALSPLIMKVGVFVNETPDHINKIVLSTGLTAVQLHGDEKPEILKKLKRPLIKSFRVQNIFDFRQLTRYKGCSLLLDSYSPDDFGGTGMTFNWDLIPEKLRSKIILAGGVSAENIERIYKNIKPAAVDLSSSLEQFPGKKDPDKLKEFFLKIHQLRNGVF
jgi:phosphoribosylanthranilate isomerase